MSKQSEAMALADRLDEITFLEIVGDAIFAKERMIAASLMIRQQAAEIERLTKCLASANSQAEQFEREWYLRGDEIEQLTTRVRELEAAIRALSYELAGYAGSGAVDSVIQSCREETPPPAQQQGEG